MLTVPDRLDGPGFALIVNRAVPGPVPEPELGTTLMNEAAAAPTVAVQLQFASVFTPTSNVPPALGNGVDGPVNV
jgi:hypothetical protein